MGEKGERERAHEGGERVETEWANVRSLRGCARVRTIARELCVCICGCFCWWVGENWGGGKRERLRERESDSGTARPKERNTESRRESEERERAGDTYTQTCQVHAH